jgi:hypothetical protein
VALPSSFSNLKDLQFVITLGTGTFGSSNANTITIQGFRASVDIDKGGGQMFAHLKAQIYGVSQSDMNAITVLQFQTLSQDYIPNTITVSAIDGPENPPTVLFTGNIINAWGNYQAQPEVFLQIDAQTALLNRLTPIPPTSYPDSVDVVTAMSQLVTAMNNSGATPKLTFENDLTTSIQLPATYLWGTAIDQAKQLAEASGIWWGIDNNILWIANPGGSRNNVTASAGSTTSNSVDFGLTANPQSSAAAAIPLISPDTDLKGYPSFDAQGYLNFEVKFNPAITFLGQIQVQSSIPKANGKWIVVGVAHKLESQKVGGAWFSTIRANASGLVPIQ